MLPPYKEHFQPSRYGETLEQFVSNTTIAGDSNEVKRFIRWYMWKLQQKHLAVQSDVWRILDVIINNEELLGKTQIVSSARWRNCVMQIRPNQIEFDTDHKDAEEALDFYLRHAQIFFLQIHENPINRFLHPSLGLTEEAENETYYQTIREKWRAEYDSYKKDMANRLLDEYNRYMKQYEIGKEETYLTFAKQILSRLKSME
jgi:hypothetical protein